MAKRILQINKRNGQKLRGFRLQNKMTQADLGSIIGKNFRTISHYELGMHAIPESIISKLNKDYHLHLKHDRKNNKLPEKSFARTLLNLRNSMNLTQTAFAKKFNFTGSHLWNIENGNTDRISAKSLRALSEAGIDLNNLVK